MTHNNQEDTIYTPLQSKLDDLRKTISPMELETAETEKKQSNLCIRFLRKKFICLIIFFLALITCANIINTVMGKLSENDVSSIFNFLKNTFSQNNKTLFNIQ